MPAHFFKDLQHLVIGTVLCLACGACAVLQRPPVSYPPPANLTMAPGLRQDFVQEFLEGNWCSARTLFLQAQEYSLRQDDFCSVAKAYILVYRLYAYLGIKYSHLLDKAMNFAQQGLDCRSGLFDTKGQPCKGKQDKILWKLIKAQDWQLLLSNLNRKQDPLFASVYARKAARKARQTDVRWAKKFLAYAHDIDSRQGWVLFLIQDWKLQLTIEPSHLHKVWIKKRITTLYDLIEPCNQPFAE